MKITITNEGLNVLLRAFSGERIVFTRVEIGNGAPQSPGTATELSNPLLTLPINSINIGNNNVTIGTNFNNSTVTSGFRHTETGIFVQSQDDPEQEVLYAYGTEPEETANYIASADSEILETQIDFLVFVGETDNVAAVINESLVYASADDLKEHIENYNNPHRVGKSQVGLGNVPNVATNDQTPTYTESKTLVDLTSGEKLSTAFGKIKKAISGLISHVKNTDNPHSVTAERIGAAEKSHEHGATEVTSGTLGVARGGTGKSSWLANRIMYPTSSATLSQLAYPTENESYLKQDKSGAPHWVRNVEIGTYTGNGTYGDSHKNTITLSGATPHVIYVAAVSSNYVSFLVLVPDLGLGYCFVDSDGNGSPAYRVICAADGKTVTWYALKGTAQQCNNNGVQYKYYALS